MRLWRRKKRQRSWRKFSNFTASAFERTRVEVCATAEREFERANWAVTPPRRHRIQAGRGQSKCRTLDDLDRRRKELVLTLTLTFSILHPPELATHSRAIRGDLAERFLSARRVCGFLRVQDCAAVESCGSLVENSRRARGKIE